MTIEQTLLAAAATFVAGLILLYVVLVRVVGGRRRLEAWIRPDADTAGRSGHKRADD
jgi:hypothetical protein